MPKAKLRFDEPSHTYWLGKEELPSVTTILNQETHFFKPGCAERGKDVHTICQYHDEGTLDPATIDPSYRGYYESYIQLLGLFAPSWALIEKALYHRRYHYAGTLDRYGLIQGYHWVVDIKSGNPMDSHGEQLAGYAMLLDDNPMRVRRACWYLNKSGGVGRHVEYDSSIDFLKFQQKLDQWGKDHAD